VANKILLPVVNHPQSHIIPRGVPCDPNPDLREQVEDQVQEKKLESPPDNTEVRVGAGKTVSNYLKRKSSGTGQKFEKKREEKKETPAGKRRAIPALSLQKNNT